MLLSQTSPHKFSIKKTANAVEGTVCPDRFSGSYKPFLSFSRVLVRDTNSPIARETNRSKSNRIKHLCAYPKTVKAVSANDIRYA